MKLSPLQLATEIKFESFAIAEPATQKQKILSVFGVNPPQSFSAFPLMTKIEMSVWKAYCPRIEKLDATEMPLHSKALEIIEETKKQEMFHVYELWSEAEEIIDPILVGVRLRKDYSDQKGGMKELLAGSRYEGQNNYFLLCRWGEALKPYNEIRQIAFKNKVGKRSIELRQSIKDSTRELEDLEDSVRKELAYYE